LVTTVAYLLSLKAGFASGPIAASWLIVDGNFATMTGTAVLVSIVACALSRRRFGLPTL
jgi:hypothetical protein